MIEEFTSGMDFEAFRSSAITIAAVERKLLIISEAATLLGGEAERLCPDQPWMDIRRLGNQLGYSDDRLPPERIWQIVKEQLPLFKASVLRAIVR